MRNYFKYPPLEWRKRHQYCVPRGPSFSSAPWVTVPIAGSRLRIKAPRHSPRYSVAEQKRLLPGKDALTGRNLQHYSEHLMANDRWGYLAPLARRWAFWGPWMTGCKGELSFSVAVLGRQPNCTFSDISFFHPKAFEMVLVEYLNDRYGHEDWGDKHSHIPRWHGPVDWQRHQHLPVFSASCKIYRRGEDLSKMSNPDHLFFFPITDQHFVKIRFAQDLYSRDKNRKVAFDTSPIQALQDDVFNSLSLELSPEAQASYDKVKSQCGDMQLSKAFPPLQWPTHLHESTPPVQDALTKGAR